MSHHHGHHGYDPDDMLYRQAAISVLSRTVPPMTRGQWVRFWVLMIVAFGILTWIFIQITAQTHAAADVDVPPTPPPISTSR
jgi:hypothetical protein